ncbi:ankyrin repeat domain-containing protein [Kangiella marina]|uniref:Ankyrin repeat domain-containing protein n=1 Tax=Kangiella marina TaxID=1079178 RepID=A0ABP8IKR6_9GAMM
MSNIDEYKRSELHYLCIGIPENERLKKLQELIASGENINAQDRNGWSPLHFAAQEGDHKVAKLLIENGADISLVDVNGNTPIWVATMNSYHGTEVITILLSSGADPSQKNIHGVSPIDVSPELFKDAI